MTATQPRFYQTGGTLLPDAPSYVTRQADRDLYEGLLQGEFCYMLTARQMGKSSLMARTAARLRIEGVAVAVLDLTAIGQNLSPEQWYDGLCDLLGLSFDLEDELEEFWLAHPRLGPLQRFTAALRQVVLPRVPDQMVIFVDEIDAVRSLPFSTDEFFAAIRECYNRRTEDPEFGRLTFCLLGVASPSDLIRDTRTTPFNIGRRIELTDFSEAEAAPLAQGFGRKERETQALLERVLYWTGGHPYLTQRLCQAVAGAEVADGAGVDRLCEELFLSPRAREQDDNLLFVRERLLRSEVDLASLLDLYGQVRGGKRVADDATNPLVSLLRLAGIVRAVGGRLWVRNRIYAGVFDPAWVRTNMPDAEVRRQRAAFQKGLLRTAAVASVIVAVIGALGFSAVRAERRATRLAEDQRQDLYAAQMNLAYQAWQAGNVQRALALLNAQRPRGGREDLRGFEWRYLWRLCQEESLFTFRGHTDEVNAVAFSPDGKTVATGSSDKTVRLWNISTKRAVVTLKASKERVSCLAFSPDGKTLAIGIGTVEDERDRPGEVVKLWDVATRQERATLTKRNSGVLSLAFSPDGSTLATGNTDRSVTLWGVASRREVATLTGHKAGVLCVAFSPDGSTLATGGAADQTVRLWDVATKHELSSFRATLGGSLLGMAFSPDGNTLATGAWDPAVKLWDIGAWHQAGAPKVWRWSPSTLKGHRHRVLAVAFSPNGKLLATASHDTTLRLWDLAARREVHTFAGHTDQVTSVAFSPDGKTLVTGSLDHTVKLWSVRARQAADILRGHTDIVEAVAFSPDGKTLASCGDDRTWRLWDVASRRETFCFTGSTRPISGIAFSPDGHTLATGTGVWNEPGNPSSEVNLWDVTTKRRVAVLRGHTTPIRQVAFSPDGKFLASGSNDGTVKLWDAVAHRNVATVRGRANAVWGVAFSPDGTILASAHTFDNMVTLWDVPSGGLIFSLQTPGAAMRVAFTPDGKTLAVGIHQGKVELWDVASRRDLGPPLEGLAGVVPAVAFSPDGQTLATGHQDGTVMLWDVARRQVVATLTGHDAYVGDAAFSPDGNLLATSSADGTVRLWRAAPFSETDAPAGAQPPGR